jgi:hypothetical protein
MSKSQQKRIKAQTEVTSINTVNALSEACAEGECHADGYDPFKEIREAVVETNQILKWFQDQFKVSNGIQ